MGYPGTLDVFDAMIYECHMHKSYIILHLFIFHVCHVKMCTTKFFRVNKKFTPVRPIIYVDNTFYLLAPHNTDFIDGQMYFATHTFSPERHGLKILQLFHGRAIHFVFSAGVVQVTRSIVPSI